MRSRQALLAEFSEKSDKLFRLGRQMHLGEDVINMCVRTALQRKLSCKQSSTPSLSLCRKIRRVVAVIVILSVTAFVLFDTPAWMEQTMANLSYHTARIVRRMIMPFLSRDGADEYTPPPCLIPNPLHHETEDCDRCRDVTHVAVLTGVPRYVTDPETNAVAVFDVKVVADDNDEEHNDQRTYDFRHILLHRGSATPVNVGNVVTVLRQHLDTMSDVIIGCSPGGHVSVGDLVANSQDSKVVDFNTMSCTWKSKLNLTVASVMRKIFPRPVLLPKDAEIAHNKLIYLDGPGFGKRKIDEGFMDYRYTWYAQGQGQRTLEFRPLLECEMECERVRAHVKEGDALIFPSKLWDVWLLDNNSSTSLSFEGYIYM